MFNRFSSEVVVEGDHQSDNEGEVVNDSPRLIKPRRTFFLSILRCLGAFTQIGLFAYLASQKAQENNNPTGPGLPSPSIPLSFSSGPRFMGREINEDWPLWLPVMHGIVWIYAAILSVVSLLHPRLSNPYKLVTHLDIIYLTTGMSGLLHFMKNDFGRPLGLWTLDDQISGLSALVSAAMCFLTLATKPLVPPQPHKAPGKKSRGVISPETRSSLYARIAFTWLHPMVLKSIRGKLQDSDVWAMDKALRVKTNFQQYLENRQSTVFVTMLSLFKLDLTQQYLWALAWAGLSMVPAFVVFKLLEFAQDLSTYNRNEALFYIAVLLASTVMKSAVMQRGLHMSQRVATQAMGMASGLIYEKLSLRKDMVPVDYEISDLLCVDVKHIGQGWKNMFYLMIYPAMFVLSAIQLYGYIGHSAWAGGLAVIIWYPISALASYLFSGRFDPAPPKSDKSSALISDLLSNLKAIKYLGWEEIIMDKILRARAEERRWNSKTAQPVMTLISVPLGGDLVHAFVMVVILGAYSLYFGQILTPAVLFTTLVLVDLQTTAINSLPSVIITIKEMLDSVVRVNNFLGDDENERDTAIIRDREMARRANIPIIGFVNATFVWPVAKPLRRELLFVEEPEEEDDDEEDGTTDGRSRKSRRSSRRTTTNWIVRTLSLFGYSLPEQPASQIGHGAGGPHQGQNNYGSDLHHHERSDFVLKNITLSFPPGQVSLITGTKESGKSAVLLALIGEMTRTSGKIYLPRKDYYHGKQGYGSDVAYVAQDPWLEIGGGGSITGSSTGRSTIRDTILFGTEMDEARYTEVLRACVLENDLQGLPNGDMTIIGDKNVIWSMSLKQRISLARAVYSDVSHILMDDCLSFVDVRSRQHIWKNCILGPLGQNKTRIIVSNQFHVKTFLNDVDYVVGIDQGIVLGHGTVREVLSQGWIRQAPGSSSIPTTIIPGASVPANLGQLPPRDQSSTLPPGVNGPTATQDLKPTKSVNLPVNKLSNLTDYDDLDSTLSRETAAGFRVGWSTFGTYIFSLGTAFFLMTAFMCLFLSQALFVIRIGWLGVWAENEAWDGGVPLMHTIHPHSQHHVFASNSSTEPVPPPGDNHPSPVTHIEYLTVFAAMATARALFVICNAFCMRTAAHTGADRIYERLLHGVTAARLRVFEANAEKIVAEGALAGDAGGLFAKSTLAGIKNSFQRDLNGLDVKLAKEFWQFSSDVLAVILILVVLTMIQPLVLIPAGIILFMLSSVALLGLGLSKEMHRMSIRADRMDKDQFKHTFRGLATIRGYGLERRALKAGIAQAECYLKTIYFGSCADRWLHWKVDLLGAFIPFSCSVFILQRIEDLDPVLIGLSLYMSLQFSDKVLDSLLGYGRIRNRLQWALERTRRYVHALESDDNKEAPRVVESKTPPASWPHSGAVEFVGYACSRTDSTGPTSTRMVRTEPAAAEDEPVQVVEVLSRDFPLDPSAPPPPAPLTTQQMNARLPPPPIAPGLSVSFPMDNNAVRTNTGVSAVNTVASGTSQISSDSRLSVASNATIVGHGYPSGSEASVATLIPLPSPSSTFMNHHYSPAMPAPVNQPVNQPVDARDKLYDSPLPQLPLNAVSVGPEMTGSSSNHTLGTTTTTSQQGQPATTPTLEIGFGPISCTIRPGEKIAVVGQAKSGKSTFIQSLFRLWDSAEEDRVRAARAHDLAINGGIATPSTNGSSTPVPEPAAAPINTKPKASSSSFYASGAPSSSASSTTATSSTAASKKSGVPVLGFFKNRRKAASTLASNPDLGMIKVDGLDIGPMGLAHVRSRFGILSQRGTIFAGTVRFNLDPHGEHEDAELNEVLRICYLSDRVKLDTELITPATAHLSSIDEVAPKVHPSVEHTTTSALGRVPTSKLAHYQRALFKRNKARFNKDNSSISNSTQKGKGKVTSGADSGKTTATNKDFRASASAPATVGVNMGRGLRTALANGGDFAGLDQRLMEVIDDEEDEHHHAQQQDHHDQDTSDDDEDVAEDEYGRVELDTNERQLLSLARILVQRSNVVVLDNCASKVTDLTAQRIDQIILQELKQSTIISVGHRLDQIVARHNRILVLDQGKIAEFDTPIALLNKTNGVFRKICNPDGANFSSLVSLAKKQQLLFHQ
ncbi:hypothetical protein BGZ83_002281 [Gryganskiella cystojenkinii]|nr:hypothetical protein BGZ83_002281 [Gryganskiella cystojenkinii]